MKTQILRADSVDAIPRALEILNAGGLVAFPTDTVYGIGSLAFDAKAIEAIYAAKDRPVEKAIPVLLGDADDLIKVASEIPPMAKKLAKHFWPGPLTIAVPKRADLPLVISAYSTVGVRVPDHPVARALLRAAGPMAVTSANISGQPSPSTAQEVYTQLNERVQLILDGGQTPGGVPSTVVDCTGDQPMIVREGPIQMAKLLSALKDS